MTEILTDRSINNLPAIAPDLVLVRWGHGGWQIRSVSERLARWLAEVPDDVQGRFIEHVFPSSVPDLAGLLDEVVEQGRDLGGIKLRLLPDQEESLADIQFAGLTEDYRGQLVRLSLRRESLAGRRETGFRNLVGISPAMREVFRKIKLYAATDASVIITGETGAGKELVAQALHEESERHGKPFAALNCTAISEQLLESELFGHDRGAFTGAVREHRGYFERTDGGTLFLDEIGDMPLHTQSKLLRVLEDGRIQRVGSEKTRKVDVRIIGATNVPLEQAVAENRFRADLYHRLAVLRIHLPPLRERHEDIPLLAQQFLERFTSRYRKQARRLTPEAVRLLQSYLWPGNVRELRNVIERVVIESETEAISARAFAEWIHERQQFSRSGKVTSVVGPAQDLPIAIPYAHSVGGRMDDPLIIPSGSGSPGQKADLTESAIRRAYRQAQGNLSEAARLLGIHRATLYRHLKRLHLDRDSLT